MGEELLYKDLTDQILKIYFSVYNNLGYGFLEKIYENALGIELRNRGFEVEQQKPIKVYYRNHLVGDYFADLVVNNLIIIELKVVDKIILSHEAQLLNYLRATPIEVGLLLNFGPKAGFKRKVFTNTRKGFKQNQVPISDPR